MSWDQIPGWSGFLWAYDEAVAEERVLADALHVDEIFQPRSRRRRGEQHRYGDRAPHQKGHSQPK